MAVSNDPFYIRYYSGHSGRFGHEFLEFDFRSLGDGRSASARYANHSNYRNDSLIRKEMCVSSLLISEIKRIVKDSEIMKEDDSKWPEKNRDGRQELEIRMGNEHISFETAKIGSLVDVTESSDPEGLRVFYYLVQDLKALVFSLISLHFKLCPSEVEDDRARRRTLSSSASSNGIFRTQSPTTLGDGILSSPTPLPREEEKESSVVIRDCHSDMDKMEHDSLTAKGTEVNSTDTVSAPAQHSIPNTLVLLQPDPGESSSNSTASNTQEFSSIRVIPIYPSSFLRYGSKFVGTQQSDKQVYNVEVEIKHVDLKESNICGYLRIDGLTPDHPTLTTFFDGEIIGPKYSFVTKHESWGATEKTDMQHWDRFPAFRPLSKQARKSDFHYTNVAQRENIFMRWKERFLVPDYKVRDISGASFEGFYYICFNQVTGNITGMYFHTKSERQGDKVWDLSGFEGIQLEVVKADNKTYTFIVKDEIPGSKRDDGREKSSISWEHNFKLDDQDTSELLQHNVTIPWNRFKATYRGREKEDAHPLKVSEIRKFSLMMRRQDAPLKQEGDFELVLDSVSAFKL
ncbi:MAG: hypothetical protein LQ340_000678 [Diploschistes diacapsis]|nr:MAG: hypothetical protein LQ340_000678 [Diploschistes diacapsis]